MATPPISREIERLEHSMNLLKDIIIIIVGLAFTNTIYWFIIDIGTGSLRLTFDLIQYALFFIVISTLIRFYHGNVRHLSEDYSRERIIEEKRTGFELALDFFFIFLQCIIFGFMSFYSILFNNIYDLFIILFIVDILWFILLAIASAKFHLKFAEMKWTIVNVITLVVLFFLRDLALSDPNIIGVRVLLFTIIGNMILDYGINWKFYFPRLSTRELTIFLAAPFTNKLVPDKSAETKVVIEVNYRNLLRAMIQEMRERGYIVKNAFEREDWGRKKLSSREMVEFDYSDVISADVLVILLDIEPSTGIFIELGWATAFRRDIILITRSEEEFQKHWTPLIEGMVVLARNLHIIYFEEEDDMLHDLITALDRIRLYGKIKQRLVKSFKKGKKKGKKKKF